MRKFLLLIALIISGVRIVSAQNEITIGNGTSSDYNAPFNNYYKHSWNETIYQKADIGGACTINSISYHRASASSYQTSTIKIYMGETTRSSMSSTTDWTPSSSLTLVYSGTNITIGDSEWETFTLNTPFEYSGEKNLVVVVAKTANSYTSSLKWYYTNSSNGNKVSMYRQNDSSTSFASHPGTNSGDQLLAYAANIKLGVAFTTGDDNNNDPNDYEYVDLNLPSGLKWATCNIGAKTPEEYGNTYAWGETQPKNEYTEANSLTFYKQLNDISGNAQYDAATANWGGNWRMPRKDEMEELMNQCTWTWTTQNGVVGYKVISKTNGKYIFLPAAGYVYGTQLSGEGNVGNYWTSTPYSYGDNSNGGAYGLDYYHSSSTDEIKFYTFSRPGGLKIRPVRGGNFDVPIAQYASVTTNEVSSFSQTTAVCGGNVTSDNGFTVTAKGVCWSTSTYPTIENNKTTDGSGVGTFTSNLSNLSPMTTYYVRAYATNAAGTTYGAQKSFTTAGSIEIGDNTTIRYNNSYSLKYIVTSAYPAECEVICPSIPSSGTSITIPPSVKIKNVECSVTSIGENAFENCYSYVTSIQIPNSVTTIGNRAFYGCSSLTSIEIPYGITSIKDNTFQNCSKLTNIEIPYSVTSIGNNAFQDCSKLTSIEIPSSVTTIGNGAFKFCSALKNVNISNGVTTIGNSAFYNSGLTSIEIPNSVITIGNEVFKYCHGLTSVKIPNSVTSIGSSTFHECI